MPADAEAVFDIVSDLEYMTTWLPGSVEIERSGPNLVRLWLPGHNTELSVERQVATDWERLRITWGNDSTISWSGTLQVIRLNTDRCAVTVDLTGPPAASRSLVDAWVESALDALETVIAAECDTTQRVIPAVR